MAHLKMLLLPLFAYLASGSAHQTKSTKGVQPPLVQTAQGLLRGSFLTTYTGNSFYSFRGVRYTEPVTGENRFKPPVPVKPWKGEYDATEDGTACPQVPVAIGPISEDCLYLNVYTKKLTGKKPVIVFFHPGGYSLWTARSISFGPQYIMNKDIVLVTLNYRLGPLGFLSTGDKTLRGNYGMKDQVAALRWVKQNIANFGGDPDKVTIMGYSAGSASVMLHMLSPMSRGLFHRAIAMSGSATSGWAINRDPLNLAKELTSRMGCGVTATPQQVFDCVKLADGQFMANLTDDIRLWRLPPLSLLAPVIEKDYGDGEERFLTDEPLELIKRGEINQVPLILGSTSDEFAYLPYYIVSNDSLTDEFNEDFYQIAPKVFSYERDGPWSRHISQEFKKFYLNNQPISNATSDGLGKLYTDSKIIFGQIEAAKLFAQKSSQPVYLYLFSYVSRYSFRYIPGTNTPTGAAHHDDLTYIFHVSQRIPLYNATDPEVTMINTLTSTWTEFARTGVPTLPQPNVKWTPLSPHHLQYLEINNNLKMVPGVPFPDRMALWESLFPLSGPHQIHY